VSALVALGRERRPSFDVALVLLLMASPASYFASSSVPASSWSEVNVASIHGGTGLGLI